MKKILLYIIPFIVINSIYAQNKNNSLNVLAQAKVQQVAIERSIGNQQTNSVNSLPEQDLSGAIPVCQNSYSVSNSYTGAGLISEINNVNTCLGTGEKNSVWYSFSSYSVGRLKFTITPNTLSDDYDFVLYDVTGYSFSDIQNGVVIPVRCNFSATGVKNQIYSAQTNSPVYTKASTIAGQIQYLKGDIILLQSELQRTKLAETKNISRTDAKLFADASSKMLLVQDYAAKSETDSVRIVLTGLQNDTTMNVPEKQNFVSYMSSIANMLDNNQTISTAGSTEVNAIQNIATTNTKAGGHANAALKERKLPHHHYFIADEIPATNNMRLANNNNEDDNKTLLANNGAFRIYPNPNTGNFKILFDENKQSDTPITVSICNLLGQTVYSKTFDATSTLQIEVSSEDLTKGVYIITLVQSNSSMGQSKLVIE